jgi:hypothetical protein
MRRILVENENPNLKECSFGLPWENDSTCYGFMRPDEVVSASKINEINHEEVESLIIGCDLEDYSFIADMVNLKQLYIYTGTNIRDVSFVKSLTKLTHLYIADSHVDSLDALKELLKEQKRLFDEEKKIKKWCFFNMKAICVESDEELDGNILQEPGAYISELIINHKSFS